MEEGYKREDRWDQYVEDQQRKKDKEEEDKKNSMFKDYNDMIEKDKNVSG